MYGVLFVCTGNICRSPTAHGIFRQKVLEAGLNDKIRVDSAGISSFHVGSPPDSRATETALRHGIALYDLKSRQIRASDFDDFDLIIAMDSSHYKRLNALCPRNAAKKPKIARMTDYALQYGTPDVPDPYYGGADGFETVFAMLDAACDALLEEIKGQIS